MVVTHNSEFLVCSNSGCWRFDEAGSRWVHSWRWPEDRGSEEGTDQCQLLRTISLRLHQWLCKKKPSSLQRLYTKYLRNQGGLPPPSSLTSLPSRDLDVNEPRREMCTSPTSLFVELERSTNSFHRDLLEKASLGAVVKLFVSTLLKRVEDPTTPDASLCNLQMQCWRFSSNYLSFAVDGLGLRQGFSRLCQAYPLFSEVGLQGRLQRVQTRILAVQPLGFQCCLNKLLHIPKE